MRPIRCVTVALLLWPVVVRGEIKNSKHDFSNTGTGGMWGSPTEDEVCIFCHTPHNSLPTAPLWNRAYSAPVFRLFAASSTLNATPGQPSPVSQACLSCHDGTAAIDSYNQGGPSTPTLMSLGDVYYPGSPYGEHGPNIGGNYAGNSSVNDLTDDHPFSFDYNAALVAADGELAAPGSLPFPLYLGKLECATCHDVHNTTNLPKLLRMSNVQSALCRTCHLK